MADLEGLTDGSNFATDTAAAAGSAAGIKGADGQDWGLRNRLSKIFAPDGRTVMLAFDHGYFQGPTSGLERIDLNIVPLLPMVDAVMLTRGVLRSTIPANIGGGVVLRASGGPSILKELSDEELAVSIDDAIRLNVAALAVQVFIGGEHETKSVRNLTTLVDLGQAAGIPVLAVTAVGKEMTRDARYLRLATRICAELGAAIVKTYYVAEGFDTVTAACPVPVIIAGGKKVAEHEALRIAQHAVDAGAAGVDMGRNIFQSIAPAAMLEAVGSVVHGGLTAEESYRRLRNKLPQTAAE